MPFCASICSERCPYAPHANELKGALAPNAPPLCANCAELGMIGCDVSYGRVKLKPHWQRSIRMVRAQERRDERERLKLLVAAE